MAVVDSVDGSDLVADSGHGKIEDADVQCLPLVFLERNGLVFVLLR